MNIRENLDKLKALEDSYADTCELLRATQAEIDELEQRITRLRHRASWLRTCMTQVKPSDLEVARQCVRNNPGKKINAIKEYRERTEFGLADAKWDIEQAMRDMGLA